MQDVTLDLGGLTVLIGDNGTGKSSILEACEILRHAADAHSFLGTFSSVHGGVHELRRFDATTVGLEAVVSHGRDELVYSVSVGDRGIEHETLKVGSTVHLDRNHASAFVFEERRGKRVEYKSIDADRTMLAAQAQIPSQSVYQTLAAALASTEVHPPFDTTSRWVARAIKRESPLRSSLTVAPARRLGMLGENLANAFHELHNHPRAQWDETVEMVRLGLGYDVEDVKTEAQPGGGAIALSLRMNNPQMVLPAYALSDGMLAYLAFVAVFRLADEGKCGLLAFDEPETHMHPELLARVMDFMHSAAEARPVLLSTHSDRLLDCLENPAGSVVLCELDDRKATRLQRPDPKRLSSWLKHYSGIGTVRTAGHQNGLFPRGRK